MSLCKEITFTIFMYLIYASGLVFPILKMIWAHKYHSKLECEDYIIPPYIWFNVEAMTDLFTNMTYIFMMAGYMMMGYDLYLPVEKYWGHPFYILSIFHLAWLIIGSVMFWCDCDYFLNTSINHLFWTTLIVGLVTEVKKIFDITAINIGILKKI